MSGKTIILVKKVKAHGGHHGGAWKVAYADFVTAMMSLFIVLWLMNTSDHVRKVIAGYFNDPMGRSTMTGSDRAGSADNLPITKDNIDQLKTRLENSVRQMKELKAVSNQIEMTVTPEGLRIELMEAKNGTFFDTGSTTLSANGRELLSMMARQLSDVPNHLSIEGHTDSQPYSDASGYSNWELSTDRANAARRIMQQTGLRADQVSQVRGYADQRLRLPQSPLDPSNRRISLIVQYADAPPAGEASLPTSEKTAGSAAPKPSSPPAKSVTAPAAISKPAAAPVASGNAAARWLAKLRAH